MAQPNQIGTVVVGPQLTPNQIKEKEGWAGRHGKIVKGQVLPETHVLECPRVKVADLPVGHLKQSWIDHLEQNQTLASCCRHPENHFVEAHKSHPEEQAPDSYTFICDKCNRKQVFFCLGMHDTRPVWGAS